MVRALLDGTKTQTRRMVKSKNMVIRGDNGVWYDADCINAGIPLKCPYGAPGDQLWVRETWQSVKPFGHGYVLADPEPISEIRYRATEEEFIPPLVWRPSIFMPRWASRITLEIVSARVERLQDIGEADAIAEGIETTHSDDHFAPYWRDYLSKDGLFNIDPKHSYRTLWESINGPGSWEANSWVWTLEFRRVQP
jgi:hypothetical protein